MIFPKAVKVSEPKKEVEVIWIQKGCVGSWMVLLDGGWLDKDLAPRAVSETSFSSVFPTHRAGGGSSKRGKEGSSERSLLNYVESMSCVTGVEILSSFWRIMYCNKSSEDRDEYCLRGWGFCLCLCHPLLTFQDVKKTEKDSKKESSKKESAKKESSKKEVSKKESKKESSKKEVSKKEAKKESSKKEVSKKESKKESSKKESSKKRDSKEASKKKVSKKKDNGREGSCGLVWMLSVLPIS